MLTLCLHNKTCYSCWDSQKHWWYIKACIGQSWWKSVTKTNGNELQNKQTLPPSTASRNRTEVSERSYAEMMPAAPVKLPHQLGIHGIGAHN